LFGRESLKVQEMGEVQAAERGWFVLCAGAEETD
jgi:hypothetical protein